MRQTIKEIEVDVAYRCFLGLALDGKVPHFTTYGKNNSRCFRDKKLISEVFSRVLNQALSAGLIDPSELSVDRSPVKAADNSHKYRKEKKIKSQRQPLILVGSTKANIRKSLSILPKWLVISMVEPQLIRLKQEMFMIVKLPCSFSKLEPFSPYYMIADSGYKTPAIAHYLLKKKVIPIFSYTSPKGVKGNLRLVILLMMQTMTVISVQRSKYEPIVQQLEKVGENTKTYLGFDSGTNNAAAKQVGLEDYEKMVVEAGEEVNDVSKRYEKYAAAQAWLTDSALLIPTTSQTGRPMLSKMVPFTLPFAYSGNKGMSEALLYKYLEVQDKAVTTDEYQKAQEKWLKEKEESNKKAQEELANHVK